MGLKSSPARTLKNSTSWCTPRRTPSKPQVYHAAIIIFLEFFAWGLLAIPTLSVLTDTFHNETFLLNGIVQGLKGLLSFLFAPIIGAFSDVKGRKPFLLLTVAVTCMPMWFFDQKINQSNRKKFKFLPNFHSLAHDTALVVFFAASFIRHLCGNFHDSFCLCIRYHWKRRTQFSIRVGLGHVRGELGPLASGWRLSVKIDWNRWRCAYRHFYSFLRYHVHPYLDARIFTLF